MAIVVYDIPRGGRSHFPAGGGVSYWGVGTGRYVEDMVVPMGCCGVCWWVRVCLWIGGDSKEGGLLAGI